MFKLMPILRVVLFRFPKENVTVFIKIRALTSLSSSTLLYLLCAPRVPFLGNSQSHCNSNLSFLGWRLLTHQLMAFVQLPHRSGYDTVLPIPFP